MSGGAPLSMYPSPIWGPLGTGPAQWDLFTVGPQIWTGKVKIQGAMRSYRWDVKSPPGKDGEWVTYRGKKTRPFRITFFLWTDSHFAQWPLMQLAFEYPTSKLQVVPPINVYHPSLAMLGISALITEDIGGVEEIDPEANMWAAVVTVREYQPPPPVPVTVTPVGPAPPTPPNGPPGLTPSPAVQQALAAVAQAKAAVAAQAAVYGAL